MAKSLSSICNELVFKKVFNDYFQTVCNFIYLKCGDTAQAQDLSQEAFVKLWNNCAKVPLEKAKSFLFTVTKNAFFNEYEHGKVILKYRNQKRVNINKEDPEFLFREKEFQQELTNAINKLDPRDREIFLLNRIEKKKYREIAEMLDISVKTVERRMHTALQSLRKDIKNYKI
ncbi:RNA polymerase sigma factor [Tenacibaculum amylolyticum]|uniref:RNA polymerase sigma factor n=1 Tax=Tenacibaculum amylolyticum TaxID=104269 RepID=UPI00389386C0